MKQVKGKKRKGFTLVELIVIVGLLAILAVIAVGAMGNIREQAEIAAYTYDAGQLANAINMHNNFSSGTPITTLGSGGLTHSDGTFNLNVAAADSITTKAQTMSVTLDPVKATALTDEFSDVFTVNGSFWTVNTITPAILAALKAVGASS